MTPTGPQQYTFLLSVRARVQTSENLTFHFKVISLGLPHKERSCLAIQRVCWVWVQKQLR